MKLPSVLVPLCGDGSAKYAYMACQMLLLWLLLVFTFTAVSVRGVEFRYHNQFALEETLRNFTKDYPGITSMYSVGKSVLGQEMWVLVLGKHAARPALLVPNVKYIANMHGNEVVGRELLLHLAQYYLSQYGKNVTLTRFLQATRVHLMPTMNPDGFSNAEQACHGVTGRGNALGYDLNRNFPDNARDDSNPQQPEVTNVINWIQETNFLLSANLHGGALVVNYPFDSYPGDASLQEYAASPDDDVFRHLALTYSRSHRNMYKGVNCVASFEQGITNGAEWYPVQGGMQDYMYRNSSGYEVLIEISCCKYPRQDQLQGLWEDNRDALINFLLEAHMGVKGLIYGQSSKVSDVFDIVGGAVIQVMGREGIQFRSTALGEYYKLLLPGTYTLLVSHPDFVLTTVPFEVTAGRVSRLDVKLMRSSGSSGRMQGPGGDWGQERRTGGAAGEEKEKSLSGSNSAATLGFKFLHQLWFLPQIISVMVTSTVISLSVLGCKSDLLNFL
ncbi:hypothetical protein RRG08_066222 [Elysia crispata]|uniref:Peptidase M14 domain-containing protein n=1 Tax=Elysia crispata TaxID=231223 RepID=A0AAE1EDZ5_9GAST|nr:hypothetical protein RRG08_066222 [Elysia crispata]